MITSFKTFYFSVVGISLVSGIILAYMTNDLIRDIKRTNIIVECLKVQGTDIKYCEDLVNKVIKWTHKSTTYTSRPGLTLGTKKDSKPRCRMCTNGSPSWLCVNVWRSAICRCQNTNYQATKSQNILELNYETIFKTWICPRIFDILCNTTHVVYFIH